LVELRADLDIVLVLAEPAFQRRDAHEQEDGGGLKRPERLNGKRDLVCEMNDN